MSSQGREEQPILLVEFAPPPPRPGVEEVGLREWLVRQPEQVQQKSSEALDAAVKAVGTLARRLEGLKDEVPLAFDEVEVSFGLKLDWEMGVLLSRAGTEASLNVRMTWRRPEKVVPALPAP